MRHSNIATTLLWSLALSLSVLVVSPSLAQEKPAPAVDDEATKQAKKFFNDGQKEFKKAKPDNYKKAIELWEKAYELKQLPLLLYNISLAYERLGDKEAALLYAQRYIDAQPQDDALAGQLKGNMEGLSKTIERPLSIIADPSDAQIIIDDNEPAGSPLEVMLTLGEHKIKIVKDGYETQEQTVKIWLDPLFPINIKLKQLQYDVHIKNLPVGAIVKLNGEVIADPKTLTAPKGKQTIEISAAGFKPFQKEFDVTGDKDVVVAALEPEKTERMGLIPVAGLGAGALVTGGLGTFFTLRARTTFFTLDQNPELRTQENIKVGKRQALGANLSFGGTALCLAGAGALFVLGQTKETSAAAVPQKEGALFVWQGNLPQKKSTIFTGGGSLKADE
jgi:hypothetical protein